MEHSPSWEAMNLSASQEIPRLLWNPEPATGSYPEPDASSPHLPILFP
jgi:hypothetical protein